MSGTRTQLLTELPAPKVRRMLREAANLTRGELAGALGVSRQTLWRWENGRVDPQLRNLKEYAEALVAIRRHVEA